MIFRSGVPTERGYSGQGYPKRVGTQVRGTHCRETRLRSGVPIKKGNSVQGYPQRADTQVRGTHRERELRSWESTESRYSGQGYPQRHETQVRGYSFQARGTEGSQGTLRETILWSGSVT